MAYKLKLPERLKLHPTFHVSFLKTYHHDPSPNRVQAKRNPPMIRVKFDKEIESIFPDREMGNWKNKWIQYLIHWKGTLVSEASWKGATLWQLEDQIHEYAWLKSTRTTTNSSGGGFVSLLTTLPELDEACGHCLGPMHTPMKEIKIDQGKRVTLSADTG